MSLLIYTDSKTQHDAELARKLGFAGEITTKALFDRLTRLTDICNTLRFDLPATLSSQEISSHVGKLLLVDYNSVPIIENRSPRNDFSEVNVPQPTCGVSLYDKNDENGIFIDTGLIDDLLRGRQKTNIKTETDVLYTGIEVRQALEGRDSKNSLLGDEGILEKAVVALAEELGLGAVNADGEFGISAPTQIAIAPTPHIAD